MADESDNDPKRRRGKQLELPLKALPSASVLPPIPPVVASTGTRHALRLIRGEGKRRDETLRSRDDVARLLMASAADMLLKRISAERAHEIQLRVDRAMRLFERLDSDPLAAPLLRRTLDDLERLWREGQDKRTPK